MIRKNYNNDQFEYKKQNDDNSLDTDETEHLFCIK